MAVSQPTSVDIPRQVVYIYKHMYIYNKTSGFRLMAIYGTIRAATSNPLLHSSLDESQKDLYTTKVILYYGEPLRITP